MIALSPALAELAPGIGGFAIALVAFVVYRREAAKVAVQRAAAEARGKRH